MKNKYGIGFFAVAIIAVLAISSAYQWSYQRAKERAQIRVTEEEEKTVTSTPQKTVSADGQALKEDCYYLMEVNGYVVVYLSDKKTPYEYTDILCDELPAAIQDEIKNGKYVESIEELFGFLENYSS